MNEQIKRWKEEPLATIGQYLCLLAVAAVLLAFMSPMGQQMGLTWIGVDYFLEIPAMVFLMCTIALGINRKGRSMMVLCLGLLLWMALVQVMRVYRGLEQITAGEITCFYTLALPLAFSMDDGKRQRGLNTLAAVYLLESLRLCVLAGALCVGILPESYAGAVRWDGARLVQMFHPTNCAALLMIGIGISLGISLRTKKNWLRWMMLAFAALQFLVQILTNGRTAIALTCMLIGGVVFCAIRKTGWKRAPLALAVGVAVMAVLFLGSRKLFALHQEKLMERTSQSQQLPEELPVDTPMEEAVEMQPEDIPQVVQNPPEQVNVQGTFLSDMFTLNSRTTIWLESVRGLLRNPKIMVCGTDDVGAVLREEGRCVAMHTHNSFLELAYTLGIPGLLLVLAVTGLGLWGAAVLLWKNDDIWKSVIALLVICLLGCGMLEPYLFTAGSNQFYLSIFFLAGLGYLHQWRVEETD